MSDPARERGKERLDPVAKADVALIRCPLVGPSQIYTRLTRHA